MLQFVANPYSIINYLRFMELVLKFPDKKPPFIGILFENEFEAARTNQSWVNNYKTFKYQLIFEPNAGYININLTGDFNCNCLYKDVKYDSEKLLNFLYKTRSIKSFNFAHIINNGDKHKVVKTSVNQALFVLEIIKIKILVEH